MPPPNKAATINDSRVQPWPLWLGLGIVVLVLSPVFIAFSYLFFANLGGISTELFSANWFWRILKFSVLQASLSASISLIGGWLLGRSLFFSRTRFKRAYLAMLNLCFVLPVIVLVLALLLFWGNRGLMAELTQLQWNLYGLTGILLAHCFLNIPYAARLVYASYGRIPGNYWKLAQQCRMSLWQRWVIIEWPAIKAAVGHSAVLIFLLCFNSFSAVLTLGGGPKSTTLEVAVYQAIKSEFNFDKAQNLYLLNLYKAYP